MTTNRDLASATVASMQATRVEIPQLQTDMARKLEQRALETIAALEAREGVADA